MTKAWFDPISDAPLDGSVREFLHAVRFSDIPPGKHKLDAVIDGLLSTSMAHNVFQAFSAADAEMKNAVAEFLSLIEIRGGPPSEADIKWAEDQKAWYADDYEFVTPIFRRMTQPTEPCNDQDEKIINRNADAAVREVMNFKVGLAVTPIKNWAAYIFHYPTDLGPRLDAATCFFERWKGTFDQAICESEPGLDDQLEDLFYEQKKAARLLSHPRRAP